MSAAKMPSNSTSKHGLILLGNSGVGKSFIGNVILGRDVFEHECSSSSVTHETEFEDYAVGSESYAVFNIPGLIEADQAAVDRNKVEIYKAFQQRPNSVVAFVFTGGSGGRIRDEDMIAFKAINDVYHFQPESLLLIVNDLPRNRSPKYEGETSVKLERHLEIPNIRVCFLDRISKTELSNRARVGSANSQTSSSSNDKKHGVDLVEKKLLGAKNFLQDKIGASMKKLAPPLNKLLHRSPEEEEREQMRIKLIAAIIQCTPHVHEQHGDIQVNVDKINELKEESKKNQQQFEQQISKLQCLIEQRQQEVEAFKAQIQAQPREINHYHERVVERSSGGDCTLL